MLLAAELGRPLKGTAKKLPSKPSHGHEGMWTAQARPRMGEATKGGVNFTPWRAAEAASAMAEAVAVMVAASAPGGVARWCIMAASHADTTARPLCRHQHALGVPTHGADRTILIFEICIHDG